MHPNVWNMNPLISIASVIAVELTVRLDSIGPRVDRGVAMSQIIKGIVR